MNPLDELHPHSHEAEQSVIGALLMDNDAIDRITYLLPEHFYHRDHQVIFREIQRQIAAGSKVDALTIFEPLADKVPDVLAYLIQITNNTPSARNVARYADIVTEKALRRVLIGLGADISTRARGNEGSGQIIDSAASQLESMCQNRMRTEPVLLADMLISYTDTLQDRIDGTVKPIKTGFPDLDERLDGGLERGTLTVVAGRPAMGKTALALALCRNAAEEGVSLMLSMEMSAAQINDRNIASLGKVPVKWLRRPREEEAEMWTRVTHAFSRAQALKFYIDDQTALNMLEIRAKARQVKRKSGLDLLVIDQLSFITGGTAENRAYELGEYTRQSLALSKELDIAVVLLAQLNRDCEKRPDKRPQLSDLASSGSIEQDAANVLFLYRDEVYNPDTKDKGVCEIIAAKLRQGEIGTVPLTYIGSETRFESYGGPWLPPSERPTQQRRGGFFDR